MRVGIAVDTGQVGAVALHRGRVVWAAEAVWSDEHDLAAALGSLAAERPRGTRSAQVALADGIAVLKTVEGLPHLKRADLAAHVQLNSRRYFLQNGIPLITDARPLPRTSPTATALLTAAHAPLVDAVFDGLGAAGLRCSAMAHADTMAPAKTLDLPADTSTVIRLAAMAAAAPTPSLLLMPSSVVQRLRQHRRVSLARWAALALGSMAIAYVSSVGADRRIEAAARGELARIRPAAEAALGVRANLEETDQALGVISRAASSRVRAGRLLADLTRTLPNDAFLVNLRLDPDGSGALGGYGTRAAAILARVERSGLVSGLSFEGAITREVVAGRELERFSIRFQSIGRKP